MKKNQEPADSAELASLRNDLTCMRLQIESVEKRLAAVEQRQAPADAVDREQSGAAELKLTDLARPSPTLSAGARKASIWPEFAGVLLHRNRKDA